MAACNSLAMDARGASFDPWIYARERIIFIENSHSAPQLFERAVMHAKDSAKIDHA
jgi:hypothetical protein